MIGLPGDATATSISGADMMRAAVAAPLPPHEQQRQQQQRQQQHPVLVQDGTAEFPLDLGSSLSGSDLLGDTGLSLDAFARPPEPTMDLSQQVAVAQAQQAALGAGLAGRGAGGGGAGGQPDGRLLAVAQQQRAVVAPTMTCQVGDGGAGRGLLVGGRLAWRMRMGAVNSAVCAQTAAPTCAHNQDGAGLTCSLNSTIAFAPQPAPPAATTTTTTPAFCCVAHACSALHCHARTPPHIPTPPRPSPHVPRPRSPACGCPPICSPATSHRVCVQDFLGLIDISFNDKVCRTSYLPQSDPPPRSLLEVYEAALVTAPRVAVYQQMMLDLSSRLSNAQAHVGQLEAQLGGSNPGLFGAAQVRLGWRHWGGGAAAAARLWPLIKGGGGVECTGISWQEALHSNMPSMRSWIQHAWHIQPAWFVSPCAATA